MQNMMCLVFMISHLGIFSLGKVISLEEKNQRVP